MSGVLSGSNVGPRIGMSMNPNAVDRTEPVNLGQCFVAIDPSKVRVHLRSLNFSVIAFHRNLFLHLTL